MRILALAPHTDDAEFGCGATIAKHIEAGDDVHVMAFSNCGLECLRDEFFAATDVLGVSGQVFDFPVRRFSDQRQAILDLMISWRTLLTTDLVYMPHPTLDMHQDHQVIAQEGLRAFKHTRILAYEVPWNNLTWHSTCFNRVEERHVQKKLDAIACYKSQAKRHYFAESHTRSIVTSRGGNIGAPYAECFDVIRWIL